MICTTTLHQKQCRFIKEVDAGLFGSLKWWRAWILLRRKLIWRGDVARRGLVRQHKLTPLKKKMINFHFHKPVINEVEPRTPKPCSEKGKNLVLNLMVGLDNLKALFQPQPFCDSNSSLAHTLRLYYGHRIGLERATTSEYTESVSTDFYTKFHHALPAIRWLYKWFSACFTLGFNPVCNWGWVKVCRGLSSQLRPMSCPTVFHPLLSECRNQRPANFFSGAPMDTACKAQEKTKLKRTKYRWWQKFCLQDKASSRGTTSPWRNAIIKLSFGYFA